MKVEIYDPAMCCSSGVCGPSVDPVLVKTNETALSLQKQGVEVTRYNLAQQPHEFMANKIVSGLLQKEGNKSMPIILVNGELFSKGEYPSYEDLCKALGIDPLKDRPMSLM